MPEEDRVVAATVELTPQELRLCSYGRTTPGCWEDLSDRPESVLCCVAQLHRMITR